MSAPSPDEAPHHRYVVVFKYLGGKRKERAVITNRGEGKAIHLATKAGGGTLLGENLALDVEVRDEGLPPVDSTGAPILRGHAVDRNEW